MAKRPIQASIFRKHEEVRKAYYSRMTTAMNRSVEFAIWDCFPGDVIVISMRESGLEIATCKVRVGGRLDVQWAEWISKDLR